MTSALFPLQAISAAFVLGRLARGSRRVPPVTAKAGPPKYTVSVVIPARNEEGSLPACLESLANEPAHELIVVDDESTDRTSDIASEWGAKVISGAPLPEGWVGKPWALEQGLQAATGDFVLFLDADTMAQPGLLAAAVDAFQRSETQVLTLGARFLCEDLVEQALHASMLTTLVYRFGPIGTTFRPAPKRTIANGQCMLVRRDWMLTQGGFELASTNMTDDIALAQGLAQRGAKVAFLDGSDVLDVQMYESAEETWREWGRSLPMADVLPWSTRVLDLGTLWLTMVLPLVRWALGRPTTLDKALLVTRFALCIPLLRSYKHAIPGVLLSPFADAAATYRLTEATLRPVRTWKGRSYERTENEGR